MILTRARNLILIFIISCLFFVHLSFKKRLVFKKAPVDKQESAINFNSQFLSIALASNKHLASSALWISTLLESDQSHYNKDDLQSWMFQRFHSITTLNPYFLESYIYGATYLSIIKNDLKGASYLYLKGLEYFPLNHSLNLKGAMHFLLEENDYIKAKELLTRALSGKVKVSPIFHSILSKILKETDSLEAAREYLQLQYNQLSDNDFFKESFRERLYAINATIDLKCLNSDKKNCNTRDFEGNPYVLENGLYKAVKQHKEFKVFKKIKP